MNMGVGRLMYYKHVMIGDVLNYGSQGKQTKNTLLLALNHTCFLEELYIYIYIYCH